MDWRGWWQEAVLSGGGAAVVRYLWHRRRPSTDPTGLQRLIRWAQAIKRAEILEAAEALNQERTASIERNAKELLIDRDFYQTQTSILRARVRELEAELDSCRECETGSTATPGTKTPPPKPPLPPSGSSPPSMNR